MNRAFGYLFCRHLGVLIALSILMAGCTTASPDHQAIDASAFDDGWEASVADSCIDEESEELHRHWGPPVTDEPDYYTLISVADSTEYSDDLDQLYDEACQGGNGTACALRGMLYFLPPFAQSSRDADPLQAQHPLGEGCSEHQSGTSCTALGDFLDSDHVVDDGQAPQSIDEMRRDLAMSACDYGDGAGCHHIAGGIEGLSEEGRQQMAGAQTSFLVRGCQQGHSPSCYDLANAAMKQRDDSRCFGAGLRQGCRAGFEPACEQLRQMSQGVCHSGHSTTPDFCRDIDDIIAAGTDEPDVPWLDAYRRRCEDGDSFACHLAARHTSVRAQTDQALEDSAAALATSCESGVIDDCPPAALAWQQHRSEDEDVRLRRAFELSEQGCNDDHDWSCDVAAQIYFSGTPAAGSLFDRSSEEARRLARRSCDSGSGSDLGCLFLLTHYSHADVEIEDEKEFSTLIDDYSQTCEARDGNHGMACMIAAQGLFMLGSYDARLGEYFDIACEEGVAVACQHLDDPEAADDSDIFDHFADRPLQNGDRNGAGHQIDPDDCISYDEQPTPISCSPGQGQQLSSDEWNGRYGCGVRDVTVLDTSPETPVEVCGVDGQQEFLMNLQCADGSAPYGSISEIVDSRLGNIGEDGRCGEIIDHYEVSCPEATYDVFMDMYFCPE